MRYKKGDYVRIIDNTSGHGFGHGEVVEISALGISSQYRAEDLNGDNWGFNESECEKFPKSNPQASLMLSRIIEFGRDTLNPKPAFYCPACRYSHAAKVGSEEFVMTMTFESSGDTSKFTDEQILEAISKAVKEIRL